MPRPHHAQGRPATRVIPGDWNTTHAPVVAKAARGACSLRLPGVTQTWDGTEMQSTPHAPYWSGGCRVQAVAAANGARTVVTVEDREFVADFLVVLPLDVEVSSGHLVDVAPHPAGVTGTDPGLPGMTLLVEHVVVGTERWERDVYCTVAH